MLFSTPLFLFVFLPVVLLIYQVLRGIRGRNLWLLLASLAFYSWGQVTFVFTLLASTLVNYLLGRAMERCDRPAGRKGLVILGITVNLGLLAFYKYFNLAVGTLNALLRPLGEQPFHVAAIALPLGISFFTFHALSYQIDVYRRKQPAATRMRDVALYIFFFPQLIAGPILRWNAIAPQLAAREHTLEKFAGGVRRFIQGLAKKVLIANAVGLPADAIFSLPTARLSAADAWFGAICYTLQIYFDFSGYSDMAVGLGKMFGFEFMENFNFPYISQSIRDFWRRWHISLSSWFRDYLYLPLGGSRVSPARVYFNLALVFFLCGLWHGASWTFVVWGLYHGLFLILERSSLGAWLERIPRVLRHCYALLVVMIGWVIFRADSFALAGGFLRAMGGLGGGAQTEPWARYATGEALVAVVLGVLLSFPWAGKLGARLVEISAHRPALRATSSVLGTSGILALFLFTVVWLVGARYSPFLYFRF